MGCSIASDFWLSDRISSWISKVLFVTRMSSEEDNRWFPTTLSWRRSRKSSKGTQRQARMCELLQRTLCWTSTSRNPQGRTHCTTPLLSTCFTKEKSSLIISFLRWHCVLGPGEQWNP